MAATKMVRATTAFYDFRNRRMVTPGQIFAASDAVVKGRDAYFENLDDAVERATAAPGEKRTLRKRQEPDPYPELDRSGPNESVPDPENDDPADQPNDSTPDPDNDDPPSKPNDSTPDPDARDGEGKAPQKDEHDKSITAEATVKNFAESEDRTPKKTTRKRTNKKTNKRRAG